MKPTLKTKKKLFLMIFLFVIIFISIGIFNFLLQKHSVNNIPSDISVLNNKYIYDNADCLSDYSEAFLENKAKEFYDENECKIFFITTKSVHGENIQQVAKAIRTNFDASKDNKVALILVSDETAEITISCGHALEEVITKECILNINEIFLSIDNTSSLYSDSLQKMVMQVFDDIYSQKEIIDDYGKIFTKSNIDMLIICGLCAVIFTIIAIALLKNGKSIQKAIDIEKEQERVEFLEEKQREDTLIQENNTPSPSPTIPSPAPSLFSDQTSFEKIQVRFQENENFITDAISDIIDDNE